MKLRMVAVVGGVSLLVLVRLRPDMFEPQSDAAAFAAARPHPRRALPANAGGLLLPADEANQAQSFVARTPAPVADVPKRAVAAAAALPAYKEQTAAPQDYRDPVCPAFVTKIRDTVAANAMPLPNTSVIFCFCNEPQSSLYHSIHSVIDRSPRYVSTL